MIIGLCERPGLYLFCWFWIKLAPWMFALGAAIEMRCGKPGRTADTLYSPMKINFVEGDRVNYYCNNTKYLISEHSRRCQSDGTWSSDIPVCYKPALHILQSSLWKGDQIFHMIEVVDNNEISCSRFGYLNGGFWEGGLQTPSVIVAVKIVHPSNIDLNVELTIKLDTNEEIKCNRQQFDHTENSKIFRCPSGAIGDYVYIKPMNTKLHQFSLCEVIIFLPAGPSCLQPDVPANGRGFKRSSGNKSEYSYSCNSGYELWGNEIAVCLPNGTWAPKAPTCQRIICQPPANPQNGSVFYEIQGGILPFNSVANYTCNPGFVLQGPARRTCIGRNRWSEEEPVCLATGCGILQRSVANGVLIVRSTKINSVAYLSCNDGYKPLTEDKVYCLPNGKWTNPSLLCAPIQCEPNPTVPHGSVVLLNNSTFYGSRLQITCNQGYILTSSDIRMCQESGTWGELADACTQISCDTSEIDGNSWLALNNSPSIRVLTCHPEYHIIGAPAIVQCLSNGSWSFTSATCEKMPLFEAWKNEWTPSIMLMTAIAVGAGTAICIICLALSFLAIRKRYQSKSNSTVFHVGMANASSIHNRKLKEHSLIPHHQYQATPAYEEVTELRQNHFPSQLRKPRSALPHVPFEADPVYAQPYETEPRKKFSRGSTGTRDDPYTTHIYAEPIDSRLQQPMNSRNGCIAETWFRNGGTMLGRKMSLPDCSQASHDQVPNNISMNEVQNASYSSSLNNTNNVSRIKDKFEIMNDSQGTRYLAEGRIYPNLTDNTIYLKSSDSDLHGKFSEQVQMIDNEIYLEDYFSNV